MPFWRKLRDIVDGAVEDLAKAEASAAQGSAADAGVAVRQSGMAALFGRVDRTDAASTTGAAFTMAVIALSAKMAKSDGVVAPIEIDVFDRLFTVPDSERANVKRLFDLAARDTAGFEAYARQIRTMLGNDAMLLRQVLESLFHIASADRAIHPAEGAFLAAVGEAFEMTEGTFRHIRAQFIADTSSPYDVLGLDPLVSNDDLKSRYRKLVRENHPDLVTGRGLPEDIVQVANRKLQAITDAYATLARERGL